MFPKNYFIRICILLIMLPIPALGNQLAGYSGVNINSQSGIFPKLEKDGWTGIAFVNAGDQQADVILTAYNDDGTIITSEDISLNSHAKTVKIAKNLFQEDITSATYFTYESDSDLVGFQLNGTSDNMMLDGLPAKLGNNSTLYFPHIASNSDWETEICLINAGSTALIGELRAYDGNGSQIGTARSITLNSRQRRQIIIGGQDGFSCPEDIRHIIFSASSGSGVGYIKFYIDGKYRVAIPSVSSIPDANLHIPHIASSNDWWTGLSLVNTTATSKTLTLQFNNGTSKTLTIPSNGHHATTIGSLFGSRQPDIKSAIIQNSAGIIGLELFCSGNLLSGILLTDSTSTNLYYPHVASNDTWWTGIVVYNPGSTATDLQINPHDVNGNKLASQSITIAPREKYVGTVANLKLPAETGWFDISSSSPVMGFELFGTTSNPDPPQTSSNVIEVGPGKTHADLSTIDWPNLKAGDEVRIYWRQEPYRSKIGLRSRGTADQPIRITGVANANGDRPVISGINATTPKSLNGFFEEEYTEGLGVIVIHAGDNDEWGYKPGYIQIEGLRIEGGYHEYQYTGMDGQLHNYLYGGGGIWAVLVENFEVRDCEITDNSNGFFVLSKNNDEAETSRNILLEKCDIHNNGNIGSDQEHNIYTQVVNITFQYNKIGAMRPGSGGISLKDRSANTVIRYNWIISGARTIDLVEPEDSYGILMEEPGFDDTWVYGNIIINKYSSTSPHAANMFHYGGDLGDTTIYRKGTLHFFNNTVYIQMTKEEEWNIALFDLSTNDETVELYNNIFYREGDANLYIARDSGNHIFAGNNWINTGWGNSRPDDEWHTFTGTVQLNVSPIEGSDPGLTDPASEDFSVQAGAAVYNQGSSLPASYSAHPVNRQYKLHLDCENRSIKNGAAEIGAFETGGGIQQ